MLDVDDTRRPGAWNLYEKFITWGAPILPAATLNTPPVPTMAEPAATETPVFVEPAAVAIESSEPGTIIFQFPF
jgi:hypothetical protein